MKIIFMKFFFLLIIIFLPLNLSMASESITDIQFMTENYPPLNYSDEGEIKGIFVDILMEITKKMDVSFTRDKILLLPWARAYNSILKNKKKCLFGMARSADRENLFKWAGPVMDLKIILISKNSQAVQVNILDDIRNLKTGVVKDDIAEKTLLASGIGAKSLIYAFGDQAAKDHLLHLDRGMIDLWAHDEIGARWMIKRQSLDPRNFKTVYTLQDTKAYFAFSRDISDSFILAFQGELDTMKKKTVYQKIFHTYLSEELSSF